MVNYKGYSSFLFMLIVVCSCGKPLPELKYFNSTVWQEDRKACGDKRVAMLEAISTQKEKLLSLDELDIVKILGKPDQNELYKRNQKFYSYYIHPSKDCDQAQTSEPLKLVIRFNAVGLAKEVSVE